MRENYILPYTESGLTTVLEITPGLRKAGYRTFLREIVIAGVTCYNLIAIPRPRPNRKARGCYLG